MMKNMNNALVLEIHTIELPTHAAVLAIEETAVLTHTLTPKRIVPIGGIS